MEDYPRTLAELEERFASEEACRDYLFQLRWPDGFRCPMCGQPKAWSTHRDLHHCSRCGFQTSVTAGTVFQDTQKPLRLWFRAIWHVTRQKYGASALGLQRVLGLGSYRTAWTWLHKLRRAMVRPGRDRLSGVMEVDEIFMGGERPGKRGRGAAGKTWVVVAAQIAGRGIGRIRMKGVSDASAQSLESAVWEAVEPGSTVWTDDGQGYSRWSAMGYSHEVVRQEAVVGEHPLPRVHRVAALVKRWLLGTHQGAVRPSHLDYYLDEYTFRFNRRTSRSRGKLFYRLVQQAVSVDPVLAKDLRGGTKTGNHNI
jgi:transposase-like protein